MLWTIVGAIALTSLRRMMIANRRAKEARRRNGVMGVLSRTGRTVADGALRLVRQA